MKLQPINTAPKNGTYILLFGDSGYVNTPFRCEICKYDPIYRPHQPWVNHAGNSFLNGGGEPLWWCPIPECEKPPILTEVKYSGWITAPVEDTGKLLKMGVKLGDYKSEDQTWFNCLVPHSFFSEAEKYWGHWVWGLTNTKETQP